MKFSELIDNQKSENYRDRFLAEAQILYIRIKRLERIIESDLEYDCSKWLLKIQLEAMKTYMQVLEYRARIEEIVLYIPPIDEDEL